MRRKKDEEDEGMGEERREEGPRRVPPALNAHTDLERGNRDNLDLGVSYADHNFWPLMLCPFYAN